MNVTVAILAGGLGTRISSVLGDTPKVLGPVAGRPFLDWMLDRLEKKGVAHVVMLLGHLSDAVIAHLNANPRKKMLIEWVVEPEPMGTLGALRNARESLNLGDVMLINGDTFIDADLKDLVAFHEENAYPVTMLCVSVEDGSRFGQVQLSEDGTVRRFYEKGMGKPGPALVNAGINIFSPEAMARIFGSQGSSLERDFLEALPQGTIMAKSVDAAFVDIGTPESYEAAASIMGLRPDQKS